MPRSRGSEMSSQRQSPRVPLHLKTTAASEANSLHRLTTDRSSPKPDDHRSPRSGPLHEKKRGTRVADLETKLGQEQEELKKLKEELASAEAAKLNAQQELEEAKKQKEIPEAEEEKPVPAKEATITHHPEPQDDENNPPIEQDLPKLESLPVEPPATDVFEVIPPPLLPTEPQDGSEDNNGEEGEKAGKEEVEEGEKAGKEEVEEEEEETETLIEVEESKPVEFPESPEIVELRAKLAVKEKELEIRSTEKESLNKQATEAMEIATAAQAKEKELGAKLQSVEEELRESRAKTELLVEQLKEAERGRAALEAEMKRVEVQTEQWRKVAEEAASVLAAGDGVEAGARRVAERCGSMDNRWSPLMGGGEMDEEGLGGGKRRGAGIRMFGDLWKKKGHHHK